MEKILHLIQKLKPLLKFLSKIIGRLRNLPEEKPAKTGGSSPLMEFVENYTGKAVDWDGHFGAQCVDLVRLYWDVVENIPQPEPTGTGGAVVFFTKHYLRPIQRRHLKLIAYRSGMVAPEGSVVVFEGTPANRFGHIGICVSADENVINLFEQDGFRQSPAAVGRWDYSRVLGWLVRHKAA